MLFVNCRCVVFGCVIMSRLMCVEFPLRYPCLNLAHLPPPGPTAAGPHGGGGGGPYGSGGPAPPGPTAAAVALTVRAAPGPSAGGPFIIYVFPSYWWFAGWDCLYNIY